MRLRILTLVPLSLLLLALVDLYGILFLQSPRPDCLGGTALVMGAAQYDGRPSPAFERRLQGALDLYRSDCVSRIVVSGGRRDGDRYSEGAAGRSWLLEQGVPAAALIAEEQASNSWQNIRLSRPHIEGEFIIVTDDLHAFRSRWVAARHGLEARVVTVEAGGTRSTYLLRELAGLLTYQLGLVR